jgi:hypothetical protein
VVEAGPAPVLGALHLIGPQSVALHIAQDRVEVFVLLDGKSPVTSLVKMPGSGRVVMRVPALRVRVGEPAQETAELVVFLRPEHEVPMIRHYASEPGTGRAYLVRCGASKNGEQFTAPYFGFSPMGSRTITAQWICL